MLTAMNPLGVSTAPIGSAAVVNSSQSAEMATAAASTASPNSTQIDLLLSNISSPSPTGSVAPTTAVPEPLHISFARIQQITRDRTTKSTTYTFDNGKSITTEPLNKQEYNCTISPSPNLNA